MSQVHLSLLAGWILPTRESLSVWQGCASHRFPQFAKGYTFRRLSEANPNATRRSSSPDGSPEGLRYRAEDESNVTESRRTFWTG